MTDTSDLLVFAGRKKDLGGFQVARVLPYGKRRLVGPFIFFDEMGPATFGPGQGIDVRPHPHIGLATVTYLFEGEMDHADSLGVHQTIYPGDVNWMTAGKGIVHSERTGDEARASIFNMHGIQTWVALPLEAEEVEPEFHHHGKEELPFFEVDDVKMRLILGTAYGYASPVKVYSPIIYIHAEAPSGSQFDLPDEHDELCVYLVSGAASVNGTPLEPGQMAVLPDGQGGHVEVSQASRIMVSGGGTLEGQRFIEWNFVASSQEKIENAKAGWRQSIAKDWKETPFSMPPGENEYIPLPGDPDPGQG